MEENSKELPPTPEQPKKTDAFEDLSEPNYPGWEKTITKMGTTWINKQRGLFAVFGGKQVEGKKWVMLAVFRKSRLPELSDILLAKRTFIGEERDALMLLPGKTSNYFSGDGSLENTESPRIVACLEGDGVPKFF